VSNAIHYNRDSGAVNLKITTDGAEVVEYQLVILVLIATASTVGCTLVVVFTYRQSFGR
jgi:hypothetical protein